MRQRLKGASVASYYPPRIGTIAQLRSLYPEYTLLDDDEEDWLEHLNVARSRGKVVPKKKRTAAGQFPGIVEALKAGADHVQNRRSSTRGSRRTPLRDTQRGRTMYINCTREHRTAFYTDGKAPELYRSLYIQSHHLTKLGRLQRCDPVKAISCSLLLPQPSLLQPPTASRTHHPKVFLR